MASRVVSLTGGIRLSSSRVGLLEIQEDLLNTILNTLPITAVYDVESTPFARGKFASVKKCRHKETRVEYAAKFIRKRKWGADYREDILHEIAVLKASTECSGIISLHEVFENNVEMILVLELAAGGELQRIIDIQESLSEVEAVQIIRQILCGVQFLHDRNIAHLDIKPQNILLSGNRPFSEIKLCDFGISRIIQKGVNVREILGTPDYIAPEILSYEPISLKTDVWSVGVLTYVLLTGYSPFGGETKQETYFNISQCNLSFPEEFCGKVSSSAKDFITRTLVAKPSKRLTISQCLLHPWYECSGSEVRKKEKKGTGLRTRISSKMARNVISSFGERDNVKAEAASRNVRKSNAVCKSERNNQLVSDKLEFLVRERI